MTDEERAEERRLASELTTLIVRRDRQKDLPKPDARALEQLEVAIKEATSVRATWRGKLFARLPELHTWRGLGAPATADDLALLLDQPGEILLQFIVDEHAVVIITAANAGDDGPSAAEITAHVVDIKRQELAERIARALDGKALGSVETWRKAGVELFGLLPSTVVDRLTAATSIVIVPDDVLWRVPFEAMPVDALFLADRAVVTYAISVASAVGVPHAPAPDPKVPIVAIHSPALPGPLLESLKTTAPSWLIRPSEAAAAEIERIANAAPNPVPRVLSGAEATRDALSKPGDLEYAHRAGHADRAEAAPAARGALHLAAPFRVNSAGPLFSTVLLAPAATASGADNAESEFEVRELFNIDPLASIVMITDPAALSKRDAAASVGPVAWAWRAAGATTVILRRWGGNDLAALDVIGRFYEGLRSGKSAAEALHTARADVRRSKTGAAPGAWAGWLILTGR